MSSRKAQTIPEAAIVVLPAEVLGLHSVAAVLLVRRWNKDWGAAVLAHSRRQSVQARAQAEAQAQSQPHLGWAYISLSLQAENVDVAVVEADLRRSSSRGPKEEPQQPVLAKQNQSEETPPLEAWATQTRLEELGYCYS